MSQEHKSIILENEELKNHTSFKIGGPADLFLKIPNLKALKCIMNKIREENIPFFVLGKGSNLLVDDDGFRGVVLELQNEFKSVTLEENGVLNCGAGAPLAKACGIALQNELSGLEFAWGIPCSCGGAVFMNAGAYGNEISDIIIQSTHITQNGEIQTFSKEDLKLSYRQSIYTHNDFVIISLKLKLLKDNFENIKSKMYENMAKRRSKQPLNLPSAGSVFKRPLGGYYAAALIDQSGLRGASCGGAAVSSKHCGFIVNTGNAKCSDVVKLIHMIKEKVYKDSGIMLECEVKTIGDVKL